MGWGSTSSGIDNDAGGNNQGSGGVGPGTSSPGHGGGPGSGDVGQGGGFGGGGFGGGGGERGGWGGGWGSGRGGSQRGVGTTSHGNPSSRRSSAMDVFSGITSTIGGMLDSLAKGLGFSELDAGGINGTGVKWSGAGNTSREQVANALNKQGARQRSSVAAAKSMPVVGPAMGLIGDALSRTMHPAAQRAYNDVASQGINGLASTGAKTVATAAGVPAQIAGPMVNMYDAYAETQYAKDMYGIETNTPNNDRRSVASNVFGGNREGTGTTGSTIASAAPVPTMTMPGYDNWDYTSHLRRFTG